MGSVDTVMRIHRVAKGKADIEVVRRQGAKALSYLRAHTMVSEVLRISPESEFPTPHEMALHVANGHGFARVGSDKTWSGEVLARDTKDRKRRTTKQAKEKACRDADKRLAKRIKSKAMLATGNRRDRVRAAESLGLEVTGVPPREIWAEALASRKVKAKQRTKARKGSPKIQVYRGEVF